jgi:hypothetical protein
MDFLVDVAMRLLSHLYALVFTPGDARYFHRNTLHFRPTLSSNNNIT